MSFPDCFESETQWKGWNEQRIEAKENVSHCRDCLPEYRQQMVEAKRCESPAVAFVVSKDGGIMGVRPEEKPWIVAVTGKYQGSGNKPKRKVIGLGTIESVIAALRERREK